MLPSAHPSGPTACTPLLMAHQLSGGPSDHVVIRALDARWSAGLHWICGDEGCGKTSLLRLLAGDLPACSGHVQAPEGGVFWVNLKGKEHDSTPVEDCWRQLQTAYPHWQMDLQHELEAALDMTQHRHKPLYMLSTGSRQKVMLVAALASGATVTLLDQPFVALDQLSIQVVKDFLSEAAHHPSRAWIVADYEVPHDLAGSNVLHLTPDPAQTVSF